LVPFLRLFRQVDFHTLGQLAAGEQHAMPAALAFQTDVRAQSDNGPFVRTAGMRLAQAHMIVQEQVGQHEKDYTAALRSGLDWEIFPSLCGKLFLA